MDEYLKYQYIQEQLEREQTAKKMAEQAKKKPSGQASSPERSQNSLGNFHK